MLGGVVPPQPYGIQRVDQRSNDAQTAPTSYSPVG
jgi:hypothetical protein